MTAAPAPVEELCESVLATLFAEELELAATESEGEAEEED